MRLVGKLTAGMGLGICGVMAVHAWLRVEREARFIETDMAERHVQSGRAVALAVDAAWRLGGDAEVATLLARVSATPRAPAVTWHVAPDGAAPPAPSGGVVHDMVADGGDGRLVTTLPLSAAPHGHLTISESLTREKQYLRATVAGEVVTGFLLTAVCGAIALAVGAWLVGRPTRRLIAKANRIGGGDFGAPLVLPQRDEIGALAAALNSAAARLAEATRRAAGETAQRLAALEQLRHADRLATVGTLAAGVAHELGTPLTVVAEHGRMIARGGTDDPAARDSGRVIVEQAIRMTTIIRQLLAFARRQPPRTAAHDLSQLVDETLALLAPLAARRQVLLRRPTGAATPAADVDVAQMQQALTNLVVNGIQAMPHGGTVEVAVDRVDATPPLGERGDAGSFARITVRDEGSGIAVADRERIFEPFFTTKGVGDGTGLGLSVTYGIVREHGGWLAVDSEPGRGACFSIHLPIATTDTAAPTARSA